MSYKTAGFTLIEMLVTIVVISLLVGVGIFGYSKTQAESRDTQRVARLNVIIEALEKYYAKNGEYPSCSAMTQSADTVSTTVLPGIDKKVLVAPRAPAGTTNSITCSTLVGNGPDVYSYVGNGGVGCSTSTNCIHYTLQYREEATSGTIKSLVSRH